jgi:hypothetical protein
LAKDLAFISDGVSIESKSAIIAMTTSSSTRLKPGRARLPVVNSGCRDVLCFAMSDNSIGHLATICSRIMGSSWRVEEDLVADAGKCLFHREVRKYFAPFACVAHEGEIETVAAHARQSGEAIFKEGRACVRAGTGVPGAEVETVLMPLREYIDDIVEPGLLGRELEVSRLKDSLDDFFGFGGELPFQRRRDSLGRTR